MLLFTSLIHISQFNMIHENHLLFLMYLLYLYEMCVQMEHEKQIKDGNVILEQGKDAMTLVFGTEKGRFLKGVGTGVTASTYFNLPRNKGSAKEEIKGLQCAVEKKNDEVKALSSKVDEQAQQLQFIFSHLAATGLKLPNMPNTSVSQLT
jgi:hypothetical protein